MLSMLGGETELVYELFHELGSPMPLFCSVLCEWNKMGECGFRIPVQKIMLYNSVRKNIVYKKVNKKKILLFTSGENDVSVFRD